MTKTRLTVTEQIICAPFLMKDGKPTSFEPGGFSRWLERGDEQPYGPRQIKVTQKWLPVETGWLRNTETGELMVGLLVLRNDTEKIHKQNLKDEQTEFLNKKVIHVGLVTCESGSEVVTVFAQCRPGETGVRIDPLNLDSYRICAPFSQEIVKATLFLVPS
jgi:hypothetical protein